MHITLWNVSKYYSTKLYLMKEQWIMQLGLFDIGICAKEHMIKRWSQYETSCINLDIWLAVHRSITFLLLPTWYTNFLFIHTNYIELNSSTCFEGNPLIIRRSTTQIVHMQPLVSSLSASDRLVQPLRKDSALAVAQDGHLQTVTIPEAAYIQFASLTSWW